MGDMIFCGKKTAISCIVLAVWSIVQLTIQGVLLYMKAICFAEDLHLNDIHGVEDDGKLSTFIASAYNKYDSAAHNCWIAVCLYIVTLALSLQQYYMNRKVQYGVQS